MSCATKFLMGGFGLAIGVGASCLRGFLGGVRMLAFLLLGLIPAVVLAAPSAPTGLYTANLKATSFTLKWAAATGGTGGIAGYEVYRDGLLIGSPGTRTFAVTGLAPSTTYSMTMIARDGLGSVSPLSVALSVTTPVDTTNPTRPADLAAISITTTSFTLTWTGSTDDVGVTGYNIYRASTLVGTTTSTTFDVTGLTPDVNNRMTVRATDAAGNLSGVSVALVVRTLADPPSATSGLSVVNLKAVSFTLKWTAATGGTGGIASYDVYRDGLLAGTTAKRSFAFTGQVPLTTYSLTVASRDTVGNVSPPSAPLLVTTPADTTKPTVPVDLSATSVTHNSFTLVWTPSTDNVGVAGYDVLKNGVLLGSTTVPAFNVTGLTPLTAYSMRVKAKDVAGNISAASTVCLVTTSMVPNAPPAVALTAPAAGATFTLPLTLTLSADAVDSDGAIAKVEFFEGATKLGETLAPSTPPATFALPVTFNAAGPHTLTARATDNRNATTDSAPVSFQLLAGLPYVTGFEASEGYTPGSLDGQHGWTVSAGTAQVTTADASTGEQSVVLNPGATAALADQEFGVGASNLAVVFFDLFAKPVAGADVASGTIFDLDNARLAFALNDTMGRFDALDGDGNGAGVWKNIPEEIDLDGNNATSTWQRLTVRLDYTAKTWDFYLNGRLLAVDLRFRFSTATYLSGVSFQGHTAAGAGLDDVYAGADNPLFTDADKDGMDDAWESTHSLNSALNDRNSDPDGDGLTNVQEYILSTNPNAADTDGDGLTDGYEVAHGLDPTVSNNIADTDGNGLADAWEQQYFGHLGVDPSADPDGDELTNLNEYLTGRNPTKGELPDTTGAVNLRVYSPSR